MDLDEIKELIRLMRENHLAEIDLESEGRKIRLVAELPAAAPVQSYFPQMHMIPAGPAGPPPPAGPSSAAAAPAAEAEALAPLGDVIRSPLVGTFYRFPSPENPAYVEEGAEVTDDTVLCIIEAMKVMNEIKAEAKGRILEILVENGHPVEFGQPLFRIETAK